MLVTDEEVSARFESPLNLLNRLRNGLRTERRSNSGTLVPSIPPKSDDIIDNLNEKLAATGLKSKAAAIMNDCLDELKIRVPEVESAAKLATIAETMNKVINAENKSSRNDEDKAQVIIYSPSFVTEEHFETIHVHE